jgi:uncharacterized protein
MAKKPIESRPLAVDRRIFLKYVGAGTLALFTDFSSRGEEKSAGRAAWVGKDGAPRWTRCRHPVPLPSDPQPVAEDATRLARFEVIDDLVLPDEFRYEVLAQWGDVFGPADQPDQQICFGYGNDFTGLVAIPGKADEFFLMVNHEFVAGRPWLQAYEEAFGVKPPKLELLANEKLARGEYFVDGVSLGGNVVDWRRADLVAQVPAEVRTKLQSGGLRLL